MILTECPPQLILCSCGDLGSRNLFPEERGASTAACRQLVGSGGSHRCEDTGALHQLPQHMSPATLPVPQQTIYEQTHKSAAVLASLDWEASYAPDRAVAALL